jgi:hypothetical protein
VSNSVADSCTIKSPHWEKGKDGSQQREQMMLKNNSV